MRKFISVLLLIGLFLISGCDNTDKVRESQLEAVRNVQHKFDFLSDGYTAIQSIYGMLSYYNDATYQKAKSEARVSPAVAVEYFPNDTWSGSEFLATAVSISVEGVYATSVSKSSISYSLLINRMEDMNFPIIELYDITYSTLSKEITKCDRVFSVRAA